MKASSPQASPADMFIGDDFHHNGAFRLMYTFGWLAGNAATRKDSGVVPIDFWTERDGYEFYLWTSGRSANVDRAATSTNAGADLERVHGARHVRRVLAAPGRAPAHEATSGPRSCNVAGWFDAEDFYGPMSIYYEIEENDDREPEHRWWSGRGRMVGGASRDGELGFGGRLASARTPPSSTATRSSSPSSSTVLPRAAWTARAARGDRLRDGVERVARRYDAVAAARRASSPRASTCSSERWALLRAARRSARRRTRASTSS